MKEKTRVKATEEQVGGTHYKECKIQPVEYITANDLGFLEGNIVKYITRHRTKGEGALDIYKVKHYADLILQLHYNIEEDKEVDSRTEEIHSKWNAQDYI
jgi:hypothetical protein